MKQKLLFALLAVTISTTASAQNIRLNAYSSYVFDDRVDSYFDNTNYYEGKIKGGLLFGAGIEFMIHPSQGFEIIYLRQNTTAPMKYYSNGIKNTVFDLGVNYIMLASNRYFRQSGSKIEGYAGGMLGADIMSLKNPTNGNTTSKTKLAWGIRGGMNYWVSDNIGIKLQAQLLYIVNQ